MIIKAPTALIRKQVKYKKEKEIQNKEFQKFKTTKLWNFNFRYPRHLLFFDENFFEVELQF